MRRTFAALALALAAACTPLAREGLPPSGAGEDLGGDVLLRAGQVADLWALGEEYVAPRRCYSACAMLTSVPNVCWPEDGVLFLHSARATPEAAKVLGLLGRSEAETVDELNRIQVAFMSPGVRAIFLAPGGPAETRSSDLLRVPVRDLISRGDLRACS